MNNKAGFIFRCLSLDTPHFIQSVWYHRPSSAHYSAPAIYPDRNQRNPLTWGNSPPQADFFVVDILIQKHLNSLLIRKIAFLNLKIQKIRLRRAIPRLPSVPDLSPVGGSFTREELDFIKGMKNSTAIATFFRV